MRALTLVLACLWLALLPREAWAQRVLLLRPPADDLPLSEAFNRVRAELAIQDFEVEVLTPPSKLSPEELQQAAQERGAFAGVSLTRRGVSANADVCVADRVTGKISLRQLTFGSGADAPRILALRTVDLLRASLRELPPGERAPPDVVDVVQAPPMLRRFTERSRFELGAGLLAVTSLHRTSNGYGASLSLWYSTPARFSLGIWLGGPLVGARYRSNNGSAVLRQELGQLRARFDVLQRGGFAIGPMLGVGAYHLFAQGEVSEPFSSRSASLWSFAGSGGVEARYRVGPVLSITASVQGVLLAPRLAVAVAEQSDALGPLLLSSVGLGVTL